MKQVSVEAFKEVVADKASDPSVDFINVCTEPEYEEKYIKGVRNVPLDELDDRVAEFKGKKTIYVHCNTGNRSRRAVEMLADLGVTAEVINVDGGLTAWDKAGFATESDTTRMPIMRQVFLTAGLIIIAGYVLAVFVHPYFVFVPLFFGFGFTLSGLTGWCGLRYLLAKMPWNS
ncbi:rhodanese-like domain-containing protein [Candidatus Kaiserbacteria bacterium]|nr:rhodanese-like domain-containing protein [Candidatus Kaiserbacteria bacterium]MCB9812016.1 rhodanese-like domain-containing protein [Candidatus Nomurabacteria bacterium]